MLIAQLSDTHLRAPGSLYPGGIDTAARLAQALDRLQRLDLQPNLLLLTGDLADSGDAEAYAELRRLLDAQPAPYVAVPGNHDDPHHFREAFVDWSWMPPHGAMHWALNDFPVRVIGLDSTEPGYPHGQLSTASLRWLREQLAADRRPTVVALHHPPFDTGIAFMDACRLLDATPFEAVLRGFDHVERVLCGHVHRSVQRRFAGTLACICPSTATEIALGLQDDAPPAFHPGPGGLLLHHWSAHTGLVTHLLSLGEQDMPQRFEGAWG